MFIVCCSLFVVCGLSLTVCCYLFLAVRSLLSVVCSVFLFVVCWLSLCVVGYGLLYDVCCLLFEVCRS